MNADSDIQILIVEDSETQALKLRYLLEDEGWKVMRAESAEAALELLNGIHPTLIIADYHLPGMRGDELCRRVRMNVATRAIPILMLTMDQNEGAEPAGLNSGADDYLSKSIGFDILLVRVRALVRNAGNGLAASALDGPHYRPARVLAVDDSPTYLEYLADVLINEGYDVVKAKDGAEALEQIARQNFDCVMVDLVMPQIDGIEICRRIADRRRSGSADEGTAVIILTASETPEDMTRGLEAGADDFVGKSSDSAVLKARIRALLRRKFFQEQNRRMVDDLKNKEIRAAREQAEREAELHEALKQAYQELRQTQETATQHERLRALGQMASGVAHDINNAISPVALYTETLLEKEPNLSPRARQYLEIIQRAIDDVAHTVGRMREFYRGRESEAVLVLVDLNTLAVQVKDLTRARWCDIPQQRGIVIDIRMDLAPDLPPVAGVESEIREALTNLVFNAVDAMADGGAVVLRTRPGIDAERVYLEVVDTGCGMDEDTRRRCLEPFFTSKGERGTGLGLAMVYGVARRHSAELEIDSTPNTGTTVRMGFLLAAAAPASSPQPDGIPCSELRILLVDDDPILLESLQDTLSNDGHQVVTAAGGQAAIDILFEARHRSEPFDAVVTDLGMPYVDGRKVSAAAKHYFPSTPVILLTGWGQKLISEGTTPPGVDCVLCKPPKLSELRRVMAQLTSGVNELAPGGPVQWH